MSVLCLSFVTAFASIASAEPVRAWQGGRTVVRAKHLIPAMKGGEGYGDKYTFDADFGERGNMYFSMAISNLGLGDHKMQAKGRLTIGKQVFRWKKKLDSDEWSYSKNEFQITAGPAKASGTPKRLVLTAKDGGNELELVLTPIAQPWRPKNGRVLYGKGRSVTDYTIFPLMKAELKYRFAGGESSTVTGTARGTRTWSELAIYDQIRWSLDFRAKSGDTTLYFKELGPASKYDSSRIAFLLVTKGNQVLIESFDYAFNPSDIMTDSDHENRYKVPESFTVLGVDSEDKKRKFRGSFKKKKMVGKEDLLKGLNAAVRMVARRYSQPMKYTYKTDYIFEVRLPGDDGPKVERFGGVGHYEVYHWNK